jgi:succinate dehydrogenase hydrophobic anchor subunit
MSNNTNSTTFLQDFSGRRFTAVAVIAACGASASLNIWGGTLMFPNLITSIVFGVMIACGEFIAATALRHIVADYENNRYWKGRLSTLILVLAITGCVISGHKAFNTLFLEADANYKALQARESAMVKVALNYANIYAADDTDQNLARWELRQKAADAASLEVLKAKPPSKTVIYVFLALFEITKIGGLYSLATPSTKGQTWAQRGAAKRQKKISEAKAQAAFERRLAEASEDDDTVVPFKAKG